MSPRRRDQKDERQRKLDISMEDAVHFVNLISICSGALLILSITAFLLTGSQLITDVIYALVIGMNAIAFIVGRLFVKKFGYKE